ncbi:MAG: type I methionyl aminopeptidase [Candidatus Yanofskybacteria bacterium RIFCSPHIGHO2_01_FULL_43_42]|uniref:Methionine aminopeptidase n=1 Tax=Candidatus Yanofskybacteria bacterium RIFCSPLOWO2_01_FULL_43_22 TaxID=1802695 RepID=A0A1F8GH19_9BACT|nr:MAG: type I methionyl aminopeptidase [Candidatus Yanofskybacteria bacterium RIFCSPHIGHO2_01_FULL_43_42]OGN12592.1 MAG: type I methionyl aminopeptidase [Candidatus Yanofskybacteria bacterium RIFCSPHIGHO2_02_FULL_43_17]OGN23739.1 MAG: type I methionyl aminopeptidase [Candidatus Yanofskybacteria bacterium RIFCSPLOWO2_01_FULL_43_22]
MIKVKTKEEIEIMEEGGKILSEILKKLTETVKPGITTQDLEELARELVLSHGVRPSFLGYDGYPAVLCASINDEIVHGVPSDRILKNGDVLKLDMGVLHKGFHTDSAITVLVGGQEDKVIHITTSQVVYPQIKQKLINATKEALRIGISKAKVGNTIGDIGSAIQKYVEDNGFNVVRDLVGHGIGRELHEPPQVLNYGEPGEGEKLKAGMVIAIEPMVVTGDWEIKNSKDGFGLVTKDGGLAAHFEHTIAVTEKGPLILTQ